jgi:hypothetical protein
MPVRLKPAHDSSALRLVIDNPSPHAEYCWCRVKVVDAELVPKFYRLNEAHQNWIRGLVKLLVARRATAAAILADPLASIGTPRSL